MPSVISAAVLKSIFSFLFQTTSSLVGAVRADNDDNGGGESDVTKDIEDENLHENKSMTPRVSNILLKPARRREQFFWQPVTRY